MPELPSIASHTVPVSAGHVLAVQVYGTPDAPAAVVVHGGPGSSQTPVLRSAFETRDWRVVCIDQRGCGASRPRGGVQANTTPDLIADMEQVRALLDIQTWLVVGGSWGASLALAYAAAHPQVVRGLLLRSTFTSRRSDVAAFFAGGPWHEPVDELLPMLRDAMLGNGNGDDDDDDDDDDEAAARRAQTALDWWRWERACLGFGPAPDASGDALSALIDRYRVQSHYLANDCWLAQPTLAQRCSHLPRVPVAMLHGQADRVCPIDAARELARSIHGARWHELPGVGHDPTAPTMALGLRDALAAFAADGHFDRVFAPIDDVVAVAPLDDAAASASDIPRAAGTAAGDAALCESTSATSAASTALR